MRAACLFRVLVLALALVSGACSMMGKKQQTPSMENSAPPVVEDAYSSIVYEEAAPPVEAPVPDSEAEEVEAAQYIAVGNTRIDISGVWLISHSYMGMNYPIRFQVSARHGIFLVPVLDASQRREYSKRVSSASLDTQRIESLLSFHGNIDSARQLFIQQQNPFVRTPQTYEYSFSWHAEGYFSGRMSIHAPSAAVVHRDGVRIFRQRDAARHISAPLDDAQMDF